MVAPPRDWRPIRPTEIIGALAFLLATWFAFVIFGLGIATALFNREIITDERAGVFLGPTMVFGSLVAFAVTVATSAFRRRRRARTAAPFVGSSLVAALIAYLAYVFTALVGWVVFVPGNPGEALPFALHTALDWPAFVIAIASLIVSLAFFAYLPWRTRNLM